ncbi:MAG: CTP synthase [Chloroflexi bacterium RBG_13_56_8]|nr:MAG: CTP synthase [Chloroflexi bacterium RBG_13_56_8]
MTRYIFCTGGVVSSLGKGVTAASIGRILKARGLKVVIQKLDPYLNVDPGTMSPYQHGEVFVLEDGTETDLDLGHYERFTDVSLTSNANVTTGQIYSEVIARERRGDFLGGTVQVIPHITDEIKRRIILLAEETKADVVIVEVGGTVGDIEGLPFLEAIRQMRKTVGMENTCYIHLTLLPHIASTDELKTKPTQHSVRELRSIGIHPDVLICRADYPIGNELLDKIALFGDVDREAVIPLQTAETIYEVPLMLERFGLGQYLSRRLQLGTQEPDLNNWCELVHRLKNPQCAVSIALVGKYVGLHDAYISVREALLHAATHFGCKLSLDWVNSETLELDGNMSRLSQADGIIVPGGFGERGIEGKIAAARYARENKIPYLGLCLGLQVMVIELARHVLGERSPNSSEFAPNTPHPVIDLMLEQRGIKDMGGTMRLGNWPCHLVEGTKAQQAYDTLLINERHRHRYEINNQYRALLEEAGMVWSGLSPDGQLVEIGEIRNHPWMVGCQFHPEFKTRPNAPHPLFRGFMEAAVARANASSTR